MNVLKPLIKQLTVMVKEGYDLGKEQMPDIGKQIIRFALWDSILMGLASAAGSLLFTYWSWALLLDLNSSCDSMDGRWIGLFILGAVALGLAIFALDCAEKILKVALSPKVFLLDTLASYID